MTEQNTPPVAPEGNSDVREALQAALFYDDNGKTVFRYSDPRVTTDDDAFIGGLIPAILAVAAEVRPHGTVTDDAREALGNLTPLTDDDLLRIADRPGGVNDQLRAAITEAKIDAAAEVIAEHRAGTVYPSDRAEARAILEAVREVARGLVRPPGRL